MKVCLICGRPRLLDAFSGEGGAGKGYMSAGFCVTAVDNSAARLTRYPLDCPGAEAILGDAIEVILTRGHEFAVGHGSPTCTGYSRGTAAIPDRFERYDRLIPAVRDAFETAGIPYVIENVEDAKAELRSPLMICWTHLNQPGSVVEADGTRLWMKRHRLFESNVDLWPAGECDHPKRFALSGLQCAGAYGGARRDKVEARNIRKGGYVPSVDVMRELLGTPWMSEKGCQLSIPPSYTEHIGRQLLAALETEAAA